MSEPVKVIDDPERAVIDLWRKGHLSKGTIAIYLQWIRRFKKYCQKRRLVDSEQLTVSGVKRFIRAYIGSRLKAPTRSKNSQYVANNALHAWACALGALGTPTPPWREQHTAPLPPLLKEYSRYRRVHIGTSDRTLIRDIDTARGFLRQLQHADRPIKNASLSDVDRFVRKLANGVSKRTVADSCSSLRAFLRFLRTTGRLAADLARDVIAPRYRIDERPPRALPWSDVQRIMRSISRSKAPGKRDYAILLLMATYGLGAAEILGLRLEDLDWRAGVLRAHRPKTNVSIDLPLLPHIAKGLIAYLRWERPPARLISHIFLRKNMPYQPMTSGAIRYRIRCYARRAGIKNAVIGSHAFRHSHATRQIDGGANIKIVSDILGHRSASSTSVYVRVALKRLRSVSLPVPK